MNLACNKIQYYFKTHYNNKTGGCGSGWYIYGDFCYKIHGMRGPCNTTSTNIDCVATWQDAQNQCQKDGALGLATIHNKYENGEFIYFFFELFFFIYTYNSIKLLNLGLATIHNKYENGETVYIKKFQFIHTYNSLIHY